MALYKAQGWQKVSEHVGEDITVAQCANRWHNYLSKIQHEGSQRRAWTAEEVRKQVQLMLSLLTLALSCILYIETMRCNCMYRVPNPTPICCFRTRC